MESLRPILSICLPTNGVIEWVVPTLNSIYNQGVDLSLYEVVITDNGENSKLEKELQNYDYPNLRYYKTKDKGFLNLVTSLQKGTGLFNKMLNHRMMLKPGMLQKMINLVNENKETKPVMYFLNGSLALPEITLCNNLDEFVYNMQYWVSWSAGIGFWDIDQAKLLEIIPNELFPNASLLFEHRQETCYLIWNGIYGQMQDESGKGGYDLFHTFGVVLPDLLSDLAKRNRISEKTFAFVKDKLLDYLTNLYFTEVLYKKNSKFTFLIKDVKKSMLVYYSYYDYLLMKIKCQWRRIKKMCAVPPFS